MGVSLWCMFYVGSHWLSTVTEASVLCTEETRWQKMEDGRITCTCKVEKLLERRLPLLQQHKKQETKQKEKDRKRVLTKWARQRLIERCYSIVTHIHRQIWKCVCVVTPAGSVFNPAVWTVREHACHWASHLGGPLLLLVNSCLFCQRSLSLCVYVCVEDQCQ